MRTFFIGTGNKDKIVNGRHKGETMMPEQKRLFDYIVANSPAVIAGGFRKRYASIK